MTRSANSRGSSVIRPKGSTPMVSTMPVAATGVAVGDRLDQLDVLDGGLVVLGSHETNRTAPEAQMVNSPNPLR